MRLPLLLQTEPAPLTTTLLPSAPVLLPMLAEAAKTAPPLEMTRLLPEPRLPTNRLPAFSPDGAGARDQDAVVVAGAGITDVTGAAQHLAAIGDRQSVERAGVADIQGDTVAPKGARARDQDGVVGSTGGLADGGKGVKHLSAVGNDQTIACAVVAKGETAAVVPERPGAGDDHGVVAGAEVCYQWWRRN